MAFERTSAKLSRQYGQTCKRSDRGPNGRPLCRWCATEVPKGRRTFCGDACVDEFKFRTNPGFVQLRVQQRDHGVCAICGIDCEKLARVLRVAHDFLAPDHWRSRRASWQPRTPEEQMIDGVAIQLGFVQLDGRMRGTWETPTGFWAADHVVPVVEGGGLCGLDGYRTLCHRCHAVETAALAARRATLRKAVKAVVKSPAWHVAVPRGDAQAFRAAIKTGAADVGPSGLCVIGRLSWDIRYNRILGDENALERSTLEGVPLRLEPLIGTRVVFLNRERTSGFVIDLGEPK